MRRFEVGDKVRLKVMTQEEFYECDTNAGMLSLMLRFVGKIHTVVQSGGGGMNYRLENPSGDEYYYSPNWIEPAVKFKGNK